jgi:hypothetical protein
MIGEISFDIVLNKADYNYIEGVYRVGRGGEWKIIYFTHIVKGSDWAEPPRFFPDTVWPSGVHGVEGWFPREVALNKESVKEVLRNIVGVSEWIEVPGPDSLTLR